MLVESIACDAADQLGISTVSKRQRLCQLIHVGAAHGAVWIAHICIVLVTVTWVKVKEIYEITCSMKHTVNLPKRYISKSEINGNENKWL